MWILGLELIKQSFSTWQWIYGKTPKFALCLPLGDQSSEVKIEVQNGKIERLHFENANMGKQDALRLNALLMNQRLDNDLRDVILNSSDFESMDENRFSKPREILLALCLTSVWCIWMSYQSFQISNSIEKRNFVNCSRIYPKFLPLYSSNNDLMIKHLFARLKQKKFICSKASWITPRKVVIKISTFFTYHDKLIFESTLLSVWRVSSVNGEGENAYLNSGGMWEIFQKKKADLKQCFVDFLNFLQVDFDPEPKIWLYHVIFSACYTMNKTLPSFTRTKMVPVSILLSVPFL